jgi:hypothetical protein
MNMAEIEQLKIKAEFLASALKDGELYAGIILGKGAEPDYHLILLPGQATDINWADSKKWAEKAGGELPTRREGAVLFANLPEEFEKRYYWTSEQRADYSDCAWVQDFYDGSQGYDLKSNKYRARAVRRLIIQ